MLYPQPLEIAYKYCFNMLNIGDMAMPHYWSNLFLAMRSILDEEKLGLLGKRVSEVEVLCGRISLYEIETYLMNSWNLKKYFLVGGKKVTQFEVERKLFDIKHWLFRELFALQHQILFTKPPIRL